MLGLVFSSFEGFIRHTYGVEIWMKVLGELDLCHDRFEPMFHYDPTLADSLISHSTRVLAKRKDLLLEDFGIFLVTDPRTERVRRLLRFGGNDYVEFLHSLEDLRGRANLAVPELNLPQIELEKTHTDEYSVTCKDVDDGVGHVLLGVLRALADDYGLLALLEFGGRSGRDETLCVQLIDTTHGTAKSFQLAGGV